MNKGQAIQDPILNYLRQRNVPVAVYLTNGIKLQGKIESYDAYVIWLQSNTSQMIYKHAISTIVPTQDITFNLNDSF